MLIENVYSFAIILKYQYINTQLTYKNFHRFLLKVIVNGKGAGLMF